MRVQAFLSGWDTLLVMTPFAALMVLSVFGLDERLARRGNSRAGRRGFCEVATDKEPMLRDPDGRLWATPSNDGGRKNTRIR